MRIFTIFFLLLLSISCGADLSNNSHTKTQTGGTNNQLNKDCSCFIENDQVCGENGQTYTNNCRAICSGINIVSKGSCENTKACNKNSGQVCGQPPMPSCATGMVCAQVMPTPKYYNDECSLKENKATRLEEHNCQ